MFESTAREAGTHATGVQAGLADASGMTRGLENTPIIVHCHLRWDFVWQRPQHIFSRLAAHHRVLFVEDPVHEGAASHLRISEPCPNVVRVVPVLAEGHNINVDAQCETTLRLLRAALSEHPLLAGQFDSPVQWFYSPMTAPRLLGELGTTNIVYDCMDELANFRFAPPDIADRERYVLSRAALVFTGGYRLYESKSRHHSNVHFFGCGVDVEHYGKARDPQTRLPDEVAGLPHPVLGYFGVIDERLDYALIERLALEFPDGSVVMVGPTAKVDPARLPQRANLHWLGQRDYGALPALVKAFDVCLMPFAINDATQYINPTKTLEYMAAGKPVVSTPVPDVMRNFTPVVEVAHGHDDFVAATARALASPNHDLIAQGIACANQSSWDAIVADMRSRLVSITPAEHAPISE